MPSNRKPGQVSEFCTVTAMSEDAKADVFDDHLQAWRDWQQAPWGRLRYRVVEATLARVCDVLGGGPLRVLDVGGGDGGDALPLAQMGHEVTVLDYSKPLLDLASSAAETLGVADRLRTIRVNLDDMAAAGLNEFHLVLCHNVLQYRDDVTATVATLASAAASGGVVSLMAPNPAAEVLAAAVRREALSEAFDLLDAPTVHTSTFDHAVRRIDVSEGLEALAAADCEVIARFGIRCVTDFIADDARKSEPVFYADLEQLELALCDREPFIRTARMWQLVGRKL